MNPSDKIRAALAGGKGLTSAQLQTATGEGPTVINTRIGALVARGEAYAEPQPDGPQKYFLVAAYAPKRAAPAATTKARKPRATKKPAKRAARKARRAPAAAVETPPPPQQHFRCRRHCGSRPHGRRPASRPADLHPRADAGDRGCRLRPLRGRLT